MRVILGIFILALTASCTTETPSELGSRSPGSFSANLTPAKWINNSIFPISVQLSQDFDADERASINDAGDSWSSSVDNKLDFFNISTTGITEKANLSSYGDSVLGIYKLENWPAGLPSSALAVTQIRGLQFSSHIRITHADILVNYDLYSFTTDGSWGYDLETVMLHELGHFLGLYHDSSSINNSVMYPSISLFTENKTPKTNDIQALSSKYGLNLAAASAQDEAIDEGAGEVIIIQMELYPNNKEIIKINGKIVKNLNLH